MIKLHVLYSLIKFITYFLAYLIVITPSGFFRAWVSKKMGDSSAERYGLMSFNPFDHIDPIGLIFLFFFEFGWGKTIPIDTNRLRGKYYNLKLLCALFADAIMYAFVAAVSMLLLSTLYYGSFSKISFGIISLFQSASLRDAIAGILMVIMKLSTILFILSFCSGVIAFFRAHLFRRYPEHRETIFLVTFFLLFIMIVFWQQKISYLFTIIVSWMHVKMRWLFGV